MSGSRTRSGPAEADLGQRGDLHGSAHPQQAYPLFRFDWGVIPTATRASPVESFFDWVRTSKAAGTIINRAGAVAAFNKK